MGELNGERNEGTFCVASTVIERAEFLSTARFNSYFKLNFIKRKICNIIW